MFSSTLHTVLVYALALAPGTQAIYAFGNQKREGGIHYNVGWVEGANPCSNGVPIAPESTRMCDRHFSINGESYYLAGCDSGAPGYAQKPQRLRRSRDNSLYGTCHEASGRVDCPGSQEAVIKRYICG
jgi:hypothetical protein